MRAVTIALLAALTVAAQDTGQQRRYPLEKITINESRFSQSAIIAVAGLKIGALAREADFDAAAQRLRDTGLFQNVGYQFAPAPAGGYALSIIIAEYPEWLAASIDVPGAAEDEIWKCVGARFPIVVPRSVPRNDSAKLFYAGAIQQCLVASGKKEEIIPRTFAGLASGPDDVVFRPKSLPIITALKFQGTRAIGIAALMSALTPVAIGSEYNERAFREMLERHILPIYEELGYLRASFPKISAEAVDAKSTIVTTTVDEGSFYTLGDVSVEAEGLDAPALLRSAGFHRGQIANWSEVLRRLRNMEEPLRRKGYMTAEFVPERKFNDETHVVDLKFTLRRGAPFYFGRLALKGFSPELERLARSMWTQRAGQVMDEAYPAEFLKNLRARPEFAGVAGFDLALEHGAAQNIVDVVITAR